MWFSCCVPRTTKYPQCVSTALPARGYLAFSFAQLWVVQGFFSPQVQNLERSLRVSSSDCDMLWAGHCVVLSLLERHRSKVCSLKPFRPWQRYWQCIQSTQKTVCLLTMYIVSAYAYVIQSAHPISAPSCRLICGPFVGRVVGKGVLFLPTAVISNHEFLQVPSGSFHPLLWAWGRIPIASLCLERTSQRKPKHAVKCRSSSLSQKH